MKDHVKLAAVFRVLASLLLGGWLAAGAVGAVRLNEVLARNQTLAYQNANPDFIELYNDGASAVDLSGYFLGATAQTNAAWVLPAGVVLPAGGYRVIWCDSGRTASGAGETELNLGASLSGESGSVYLFDPAGQPVDFVDYGFQVKDLSFGRVGGQWILLALATPGAANSGAVDLGDPLDLRLNEWMADPASGADWFELYNRSARPVALAGCLLTCANATATTAFSVPELSFIGPDGWAQYLADKKTNSGANHTSFALSKQGAVLSLASAGGAAIDRVEFGAQATGESEGRLPDGAAAIARFATTPTPGSRNYLPLTNVWINELLSHTDPPLEDAVELYNPTAAEIDIGGWFLSNASENLKKYRIPAGAKIPAGGFYVIYEYQFIGNNNFTFNSAHGDQVYLSSGDTAGNFTGYRAQLTFGASANGVSFGRYPTSVGAEFVALSRRTFGVDNPASLAQFRAGAGASNAYPLIGPLVISEIMSYPPLVSEGTNLVDDPLSEYVELFNVSSGNYALYDVNYPTNTWKVGGGIQFTFPAGLRLASGASLLLVNFDPAANAAALAAFRARYPSLPASTPLFGPYSGKLGNDGDAIELYKPDPVQLPPHPDAGYVPYVLVERVVYQSAAPWPAAAAGSGFSLHRLNPRLFGNDPVNWRAAAPTPGRAESTLLVLSLRVRDGAVVLSFPAEAGQAYRALGSDQLANAAWTVLKDIPAQTTAGTVEVQDSGVTGRNARFYQLMALP
jgi:hypothetical protein